MIEAERPNRRSRRQHGKSDPIDAEAAARAALSRTSTAAPKNHCGVLESIRVLRAARQGAIKARTAAINHLKALVLSAPEKLRAELLGLGTADQVKRCAGFRADNRRSMTTIRERSSP